MKAVCSAILILGITIGLWEAGQNLNLPSPAHSQSMIDNEKTSRQKVSPQNTILADLIRTSTKIKDIQRTKTSAVNNLPNSSLEEIESYINHIEDSEKKANIPYYEKEVINPPAPYLPPTPEQEAYKQSVLLRLHTRASNKNTSLTNPRINETKSITETIPPLGIEPIIDAILNSDNEITESALEELASDFTDYEQFKSETELSDTNSFNFSQQEFHLISIESKTPDGAYFPHTKFIIENSAGNIILESCTNSQGQFTTQLKAFKRERLYLRFFSSGLSQDKILLNKGEEQ